MQTNISRFLLRSALAASLAALTGTAAMAQGILYPRDGIREQPFYVKSVQVSSVILDALAETTVKQTFVNNSSTEQEGTYIFPLPDGATVTSFTLTAGDRVLEGRLLGKDEARGIYESIVRKRKDPALLEYMGRGLFRASVFPIPAHGERLLTLKYAETIKPEGGLRKFSYPLSTGRFSTHPIEVTSVSVKLRTSTPLKTVYSPSHDVSVRRTDDSNATASWEGRSEFPDRDFQLYYATNNDDVGLSLLTYQSGDRDGYFMLVASPRFSIPKERILPKQIVFVLDRTGSMQENNKMEQGKNALKFCLNNLNANDRFDVITFNETPDILTKSLVPASTENVEKAQKFVAGVEASGGTNIDEALRAALGLLKNTEGTQKMVVFLTDGLPTVGETNIDTILANVQRLNGSSRLVSTSNDNLKEAAGTRARIFSFGVGYDVNVPFLDRLSEQNRAEADYVRPTENIESIVSAFYSKVTSPILANLSLAFNGAEVYDVYPKELPDLFKGGQLIISGRYRGNPSGGVKLAGYAQNQQATYTLANGFGDSAARSGLVPRIWATRKIGYLLDQVRLHANKEVIDEIVRLSKEYGIITPYTSYLADERTDRLLSEVANPAGGTIPLSAFTAYKLDSSAESKAHAEARKDLTDLGLLYQRGDAGAGATARAINSRGYQNAGQAPSGAQGGFGAGGGRGGGGFGLGGNAGEDSAVGKLSRSQVSVRFGDAADFAKKNSQNSNRPGYQQVSDVARVQSVGGRTFYKSNNVWFDNNYPSGQKVVKVQALSDAHFQLLKAVPDLNKYAAVGDEVVLNLGKISVQFGKEGKEKLTDAELKELTGK